MARGFGFGGACFQRSDRRAARRNFRHADRESGHRRRHFQTTRSHAPRSRRRSRCSRKFRCPTFPARQTIFAPSQRQTNDDNQYNARLDHRFSSSTPLSRAPPSSPRTNSIPSVPACLNEALLPGFGRNLDDAFGECRRPAKRISFRRAHERVPVRLAARFGRTGRSQRGNSFRRRNTDFKEPPRTQ